jgi:hypothetical protein
VVWACRTDLRECARVCRKCQFGGRIPQLLVRALGIIAFVPPIFAAEETGQTDVGTLDKKTAAKAFLSKPPYAGLRGRYDFSKVWYSAARAEIVGVGSSLMWHDDYDGRTFDTVTHGLQITSGIRF